MVCGATGPSGVGSSSCCCVWHITRAKSSNQDSNDGYCLLFFLQRAYDDLSFQVLITSIVLEDITSNCLRWIICTLIFSPETAILNSLFSAFSLYISGWFDTSISLVYEPAYPRYAQCCIQFCASIFWDIFNPIETPQLHSLHCWDAQESMLCHIYSIPAWTVQGWVTHGQHYPKWEDKVLTSYNQNYWL